MRNKHVKLFNMYNRTILNKIFILWPRYQYDNFPTILIRKGANVRKKIRIVRKKKNSEFGERKEKKFWDVL